MENLHNLTLQNIHTEVDLECVPWMAGWMIFQMRMPSQQYSTLILLNSLSEWGGISHCNFILKAIRSLLFQVLTPSFLFIPSENQMAMKLKQLSSNSTQFPNLDMAWFWFYLLRDLKNFLTDLDWNNCLNFPPSFLFHLNTASYFIVTDI